MHATQARRLGPPFETRLSSQWNSSLVSKLLALYLRGRTGREGEGDVSLESLRVFAEEAMGSASQGLLQLRGEQMHETKAFSPAFWVCVCQEAAVQAVRRATAGDEPSAAGVIIRMRDLQKAFNALTNPHPPVSTAKTAQPSGQTRSFSSQANSASGGSGVAGEESNKRMASLDAED